MASYIKGIDHAIVGVKDLDKAKNAYETLGFRITPKGRHIGWGTANHCIMFDADYLELLGIVDPDAFTNNLDSFLASGEGMLSISLGTADSETTQKAWARAGLNPGKVADLGRLLEPDTELHFNNVMLEPEATAGLPLFACQHRSADQMRQPDWLDHPNGAIGIRTITVVTAEPSRFVEPMAKVFGASHLTETDDTLAVHTGRGIILFATADDLDMIHPQFDAAPDDDKPRIAVLSLRVRDIDATARWLEKAGVPYQQDISRAIGIEAEHAHGVMLEFTD